ncbi:hypothetical protein [Costertonia aggregata]|uniref:Uncharacterized protein n=1 Tax=Costertonia aggregata TaxID=343403 RepID=A0A7H9ALW2_9FLAO|nr:hypothetical protein [Costertonia aggregata]QLG44438.1 hypothetical protein HYG79_03440 [Costertonia aggregata]
MRKSGLLFMLLILTVVLFKLSSSEQNTEPEFVKEDTIKTTDEIAIVVESEKNSDR